MNYNSFFGFSDLPFQDDLDQRFLFLSKQFKEFLGKLTDFADERRGIAVVSGEEGVGKTMLVQALLSRLPPSFQPLAISQPAAEPLAITLMLAQELNITLKNRNLVKLTPLVEAVQNAAQQDKYFLLVMDDAHALTDQNLEEIYVLAHMEQQARQLMPILLVGGKGLVQKLASATNRRLQGLIRHNLVLTGLSFEETTQYIDHRLRQVGSSYKACFAEGCSGQLFSRTGGLPRRINQACDQALNRAWQEDQTRVTRDLLGGEEPIPATHYKPLTPLSTHSSLSRIGAWSAALLLVGLMGYVAYSNFYAPPQATPPQVAEPAPAPIQPAPVTRSEPVAQPSPVTPPAPAPETEPAAAAPPAPETVAQEPPAEQVDETPAPLAQAAPEPESTREFQPLEILPWAEGSAGSPQKTQASAEEATPRPPIHRVAPEDGGLLRIVADYYPDMQEIAYNAVILANLEINNEDVIYPGQKLSLPEVEKNNNVITLNNNQHYSIYKQFYTSSQVEPATARLSDQGIRHVVRETRLPGAGPIYRIFLGGYDSKEELEKARAAAEKN